MSYDDEEDPEVAADARLRSTSTYDRSRSGGAAWSRAEIVGQWRCRVPKCGAWVDVPDAAMDAFVTHNARLRAQGEEPLDMHQIMFCDRCRAEFVRSAADRRRAQVEKMRAAIIELKETRDAARERELLDQLKLWHHPDIDGLERWLRERTRSANASRPRRDL